FLWQPPAIAKDVQVRMILLAVFTKVVPAGKDHPIPSLAE
ncbi:unnamed protein product, partial [marine sediment metagenome]